VILHDLIIEIMILKTSAVAPQELTKFKITNPDSPLKITKITAV
jgi:hypothetical protein